MDSFSIENNADETFLSINPGNRPINRLGLFTKHSSAVTRQEKVKKLTKFRVGYRQQNNTVGSLPAYTCTYCL